MPKALEVVLDQRALAALVLQAVRRVEDGELVPPATAPGLAFQPRAMLAMLAYCYAIGVYGSWDVEQMMDEDAHFRTLCGREFPDWRRLRRFRRENRAVLGRTLAETFRNAWRFSCGRRAAPEACGREMARPAGDDGDWFAAEAEARMARAMFIDLMEVE